MRIVLFLFALNAIPAQAQTLFGREPNTGQLPSDILFFQRSGRNSLFFTRDSMRFHRGIEVQIENASPQAIPTLVDPLPANYNYILGNNPSNWVASAKQYGTVRLPSAYPGINASWIGRFCDGQERLTFNLTPGKSPTHSNLRRHRHLPLAPISVNLRIAFDASVGYR